MPFRLRYFLFCLFFLNSFFSKAQPNLSHTWSKSLNNTQGFIGSVEGKAIVSDNSGNTYVVGQFYTSADFDPGAGAANLISAGSSDIFFAKYDASGNYVFAKQIGSTQDDIPTAITIDAAGNICITGSFIGTVDFDPGSGTANLTTPNNSPDIFFAKYDASGNYLFAKKIGSTGFDYGYGISTDAGNNIYLTGTFQGFVDFDPGAGTTNIFASGSDLFIAKYDASGNFAWVKTMGGTTIQPRGIKIDNSGNIILAGDFSGTLDFDPGGGVASLTSAGSSDIFFAKYDGSGNYIFANRIGSTSIDIPLGLTTDAGDNIYLSGYYQLSVDFDPGAGTQTLTNAGTQDGFFAKYNSSGAFVLARRLGGTGADFVRSIAVNTSGTIYITGDFTGTVDFDPGAGTQNLISAGSSDIFIGNYDASGNYVYARRMGGTFGEAPNSIAIDGSNNVYITGLFLGTTDFDPGAGTVNLVGSTTYPNSFVSSLNSSGNYRFAGLLGGGVTTPLDEKSNSIVADANGNVIITGNFSGTVDFDPGSGVTNLTSLGDRDIFLAKYNTSGELLFAHRFGSTATSFETGTALAVDASGNIYLTGTFGGSVDFDPGAGTASLTSAGGEDVFFAKYDENGVLLFAKRIGGTTGQSVYAITIDASNNIYIAGNFFGTTDFDPDAGTVNLTSAGGGDLFFAKYNSSGAYVLARRMGNTSNDMAFGLAVDATNNIYVTGYFGGTVDFDPGAGTANLVSAGGNDIFFAKYDASGNYLFARRAGSTGSDIGYVIRVDNSNNLYVGGVFDFTVDFDPGAGTANLAGSISDVFFAKYDASGNYAFAKNISSATFKDLKLDISNNIYITGGFNGNKDFDTGPGTFNLNGIDGDIYIAKYDASGNFAYAKGIGGLQYDEGSSLFIDASNRLYLTGTFVSFADLDPTIATNTIASVNASDIFIAKYEECTSPFISTVTTPGSVTISGTTQFTDGGCKLIATITPNGTNPVFGSVTGTVWVEPSVPTFASQPFVARHYEINPAFSASVATGRVTLYFTQQEFDDFNNHPGSTLNLPANASDATGISNLRIGKYSGISNNGTGLPGSYTGSTLIINPADSDIIWNGTANRWEVSFNVTGFSGFIVQTVSGTLPVTLLEFEAKRKNQTTDLSWLTASEQNNKGFTVQRSSNGLNFTDIGFVPAAGNGNSAAAQKYSFTDLLPFKGRNYYRLLQQDIDGKTKSSEIRIVDFSKNSVVTIYPNPTVSVINISISSAANEQVQLRITDITGRVLKLQNYNNASGTIQLDVNNLSKGIYMLEFWVNDKKQVYSFIKQ